MRNAVLGLAEQMLQRDPKARPTIVQLLADLGQVQMAQVDLSPAAAAAPGWKERQ